MVEFTATVAPGECGDLGNAATHVTFYVGNQPMGGAVPLTLVDGILTASATYPLLEEAGYPGTMYPDINPKIVTAEFSGIDPDYIVEDATTELVVTQEDACATYVSSYYFNTDGPEDYIAELITLQLYIDQVQDGYLGDIGLIEPEDVTITAGISDGSGTMTALSSVYIKDGFYCQDFRVELRDDALPSVIIQVEWTIGATGGYYTNQNEGACDDQNTIIIVSAPGLDFVTGGGYIIPGNYVDADGLPQTVTPEGSLLVGNELVRANFGFNAKWASNFKKLKGNFNTILRLADTEDGTIKRYQARTNTATGLIITPLYIDSDDLETLYGYRADIIYSRVNIRELCDLDVCWGDGNATIVVTVFDYGEPALDGNFDNVDLIGYAVYSKKGELYFSTDTYTPSYLIKTEMQPITNGNIQVHGHPTNLENNYDSEILAPAESTMEAVTLTEPTEIKVYPNPFARGQVVTFEFLSHKDTHVTLDIFGVSGNLVEKLFNADVEQDVLNTVRYTPSLKYGTYFYRLITTDEVLTGEILYIH